MSTNDANRIHVLRLLTLAATRLACNSQEAWEEAEGNIAEAQLMLGALLGPRQSKPSTATGCGWCPDCVEENGKCCGKTLAPAPSPVEEPVKCNVCKHLWASHGYFGCDKCDCCQRNGGRAPAPSSTPEEAGA